MSERSLPSLHIAIAAKGACDLTACLDALAAGSRDTKLATTIHIVHDQPVDISRHIRGNHRFSVNADAMAEGLIHVQTTRCPESTSILKLWGNAIANATADYIAVIDSNCPPADDWLVTVARCIEQDVPLFYGSVEPGWALDSQDSIGYLIEYAQFKSPVDCESEFPGNNIVFKAELLGPREALVNEGFFKTFMLWRLKERNTLPVYCDGMSVNYRKKFKFFHYMRRRMLHGRCFGGCRLKQRNQPSRMVCILFTPALFLLRTLRIYGWIKAKPELVKAFVRYLPIILCSEIFWSYGEFLGYSFGEGEACQYLD